MSTPVAAADLRAAIDDRGATAYLISVGEDGRPHAVHVPLRWREGVLLATVGRRSAANVRARTVVSLLFPLRSADDYTLLVDGTAVLGADGEVRITPTHAVLHRPAAVPVRPGSCAADCVPLTSGSSRSR